MQQRTVTTLLDALALLLLAAGAGTTVLTWRLGVALLVAGVVLLGGVRAAEWSASRP